MMSSELPYRALRFMPSDREKAGAAMRTELPQGPVPSVELEVTWLRQATLPFEVGVVAATQRTSLVILQGEFDGRTASQVRDAVMAAIDGGAESLVLDLSAVSSIDSLGLSVIILAARRLRLGAVAVVLPYRGLVRIFRICGLDRLLEIYETREQALRGLLG
jgi:anti-sigma B factor antagonist